MVNENVLYTYDKQSKLNYREQARKKLHVYFGSRDEIHHPIREQFNNAFDEISSNFKEGHIFAELSNNDRTFTIEDTGRGMPLPIEEDGFKYWESMFLTLFSGGKYDNNVEDNNGGTNGVGNACTNYTSNKFECTSYFMGEEWYISFKDGGILETPLTNKGKTNKHGTRISFELDDRVYTTEPVFDFNVIKEYAYKCSASFPNIDITLKHEDEIVEINKRDLNEYFKHNAKLDNYLYLPKKELMSKYTDTETGKKLPQKDTITAYFYPVCENVFQQTNLNGIWLRDNGYIYDGIIDGIKNYVNEYCNKERLFKGKEKEIKKEDVICSVSFIVDFTSSNVSYEGQTKFLTKSLLYKQETRDSIYEILEIIMNENKEDFDKLVKQCLLSMRARLRADEARKGKKSTSKTIEKPDIEKLYDMTSFPRDLCEEYVVEGTSAGGSAKNASDKRFQAVLPTKGKILNVEKQTLDKVLGSETLKTFSNGIGIKIGEKYDKSKLRFGKIIIMSDADVDGYHIRCLWLTYLYRHYLSLIENGHIFIAQPPLYKVYKGKKEKYVYPDDNLEEVLKEFTNGYEIQRYKGLGEMDAEQLWETTMNPLTRRLLKVSVKEAEICNKIISDLMGDSVEPRKDFLLNADIESDLDI